MKTLALVLALAGIGAPAGAQVVVDRSGVHTPGTVIDSHGVHTAGADVSSSGVRVVQARGHRGGVSISRNGIDASMDCRGGSASILGNHNHLRLVGCSALQVPGNFNDISVDLVAPASVAVPGNHNHVSYRNPPGSHARVSVLGYGDVVAAAR